MAEKVVYQEKYKQGMVKIREDFLPRFSHVPREFILKEAEIRSNGRIIKDGVELEFQDIRVYFKEGVISG